MRGPDHQSRAASGRFTDARVHYRTVRYKNGPGTRTSRPSRGRTWSRPPATGISARWWCSRIEDLAPDEAVSAPAAELAQGQGRDRILERAIEILGLR